MPKWNKNRSEAKRCNLTETCKLKRNKAYMIDGMLYKVLVEIMRLLPLTVSTKIMSLVQSGIKARV